MADGNARGLDDEALRRLCLALAPLLVLSIGLRSSGCEPRVPGETERKDTPLDEAIFSGAVERGRAVSARIDRCAAGERERLRWLAEHGGPAATVASLSQCLAEQHGPIALREALPAATAAVAKAERLVQHAQARAATSKKPPRKGRKQAPTVEWIVTGPTTAERAQAETSRAQGALEAARARETGARAALIAWGRVRLEAAHAAWCAAGEGR